MPSAPLLGQKIDFYPAVFGDQFGTLKLDPQSDMTAREAFDLTWLLLVTQADQGRSFPLRQYVRDRGLGRHFQALGPPKVVNGTPR